MNKLLAVECATDACSVALAHNGEITQIVSSEPRSNARVLLPMIDELLVAANLPINEIAALNVTIGPGSFTGIRIGIAIVQGLAYGGRLPVYTWNTLEIIAAAWFLQANQQGRDGKKVVVALDARMGEIYHASYSWNVVGAQLQELQAPAIHGAQDFEQLIKVAWSNDTHIGLGSGFATLDFPGAYIRQEASPEARTMLQLLPTCVNSKMAVASAADLAPLYLRNEVTWKKRERIRS